MKRRHAEMQVPLEAGKGKSPEERQPSQDLDSSPSEICFELLTSRTINLCSFGCKVCGHLLHQPHGSKTGSKYLLTHHGL